jgi:hypothetical protein
VNNHSHCTVCGECLFDPHACGGKCLGVYTASRIAAVMRRKWSSVGHLFTTTSGSRGKSRWWDDQVQPSQNTRPGTRYYARCPVCGFLVDGGKRHSCSVDVDHFSTRSRPFSYERPWKSNPSNPAGLPAEDNPPRPPECGDVSPLGGSLHDPRGSRWMAQGVRPQGKTLVDREGSTRRRTVTNVDSLIARRR